MKTLGKLVTLDDILVSNACIVKRLKLKKSQKNRFAEMGLHEGACIIVQRRAPLGCPLQISLKNCSLCIRSEDAKNIVVLPTRRQ